MPAPIERIERALLAAALAMLVATPPAATGQDAKLLTPPARQVLPAAPAPIAKGQPALLPGPTATAQVADAQSGLKVSKGAGILPNEHGQVWREYDISPYAMKVRDVARPEQAIIDWILRETGTEVWFSEPLGILNANSTTLRVYHTPEMQERVSSIVERFVGGTTEPHVLGVRLMTVGSPSWRATAFSLLKPVDVKSPGVEAWLLSRENAAVLYEQLKPRGDFREHSSPRVEVANGQVQTLARTQPRNYVRGIQPKREFPFYDTIPGKIDEGYSLQISPLLSLDGQTIEAAITCNVDQIEKLVPLAIDVPIGGQSQRVQIQVPQLVSWRLSERFRWPKKEVLLLSCGIVASPAPATTGVLSVLSPLGVVSGNRADALLMIEDREPGPTSMADAAAAKHGQDARATQPAAPLAAKASPVTPPIAKPAPATTTIGTPTGSANSISRGRY